MDVSENNGTPKWMVKIKENPIKMDDLGMSLFLKKNKDVNLPGCRSQKQHLLACPIGIDNFRISLFATG